MTNVEYTSDRVNVVHGRWEYTMTGYPYCSACGWMPEEDEMTHGFYDYCPRCGAKMDGERRDDDE